MPIANRRSILKAHALTGAGPSRLKGYAPKKFAEMRTPVVYKILELLTGILLFSLTLFLAWAFGVNGLPWALWTVRGLGWVLAALLLCKWVVRWRLDFAPPQHGSDGRSWPAYVLAGLTVVILAWVLVSGLNARADATFGLNSQNLGFTVLHYRDHFVEWLPHSYDLTATRNAFWTYTGLAGAFWSARDWFRGFSRRERRLEAQPLPEVLPDRIRLWLWVWILSTLVMGVTGVLQKLDGTRNLLWILPWGKHTLLEMPFGPYMYRANAAQYFNLVWPAALGFWWLLRQNALARNPLAPLGSDASVVLLPITGILAACPAITLTRGGTVISALLLFASAMVFLGGRTGIRRGARWSLAGVFSGALLLIIVVAGSDLAGRFARDDYHTLDGRTPILKAGLQMASDFGWLGSGPESVPAIYHLYRETAKDTDFSEGYLHNDWLETVVTFGRGGALLVVLALAMVPTMWFLGRGHPVSGVFGVQIALGLTGMLLHAAVDFPFQVVALLGSWLLLAALFTSIAPLRRR